MLSFDYIHQTVVLSEMDPWAALNMLYYRNIQMSIVRFLMIVVPY